MIRRLFTMTAIAAMLAVPAMAARSRDGVFRSEGVVDSDVTVTAATAIAGRFVSPPGSRNAITLPAFCRVVGVAKPGERFGNPL